MSSVSDLRQDCSISELSPLSYLCVYIVCDCLIFCIHATGLSLFLSLVSKFSDRNSCSSWGIPLVDIHFFVDICIMPLSLFNNINTVFFLYSQITINFFIYSVYIQGLVEKFWSNTYNLMVELKLWNVCIKKKSEHFTYLTYSQLLTSKHNTHMDSFYRST